MKKICNFIIDILLITLAFAFTDAVMTSIFHGEHMLLELCIYIVFYGLLFGAKKGVIYLWKKAKQEKQ